MEKQADLRYEHVMPTRGRITRNAAPPRLDDPRRCRWARGDALLADYHDREWGRPIDTDAGHLERMALEIFQCGLSWKIVLVKRPALREAFEGFDVATLARWGDRHVDRVMTHSGVIRNRRKIQAVLDNARAFAALAEENGGYVRWLERLDVSTPARRRDVFSQFRERFRFMGPETTKCYLWGAGKIAPPHERRCWLF